MVQAVQAMVLAVYCKAGGEAGLPSNQPHVPSHSTLPHPQPPATHPAPTLTRHLHLPPRSVLNAARSWDGELPVAQRAASASLASSGTPFRTKAPPSGNPGTPATQGSATAQGGSGAGPSPLGPTKQPSGGVAVTASAGSQAADTAARTAASKEKQAAAEQAKAIQQQLSKLEKQVAAEAGADHQGGSAAPSSKGGSAAPAKGILYARPSDISLRERQLVARQGDVVVAPALEKTLSGVPQHSAAAAQQVQQAQRRSVS